MKFRDTKAGDTVLFNGVEFTVKEHVRGRSPTADITVCSFVHPGLVKPENTFSSDLECQPVSTNAQNNECGSLPGLEGGEELRSDDRAGRAGEAPPAGVQAQVEAQPQTA